MHSNNLHIPTLVALLLLTPSQAELHGLASFAHAEALCALRGGFWGTPRSPEETEAADDGEWEYYEEDDGDDDDGDDDDGDDDDGDEDDGDELQYEVEEGDAGFYGKVQDIDGEFLSDGDAVDSAVDKQGDSNVEEEEQDQSVNDEQTVSDENDAGSHSDQVDKIILDMPITYDSEAKLHDESLTSRFLLARRNTKDARAQSTTSFPNPKASSSKTRQSTSWWSAKKQPKTDANRRPRTSSNRAVIQPTSTSSSGASFIYSPLVYKLSSMVRDISMASSVHARSIRRNRGNIISRCVISLTKAASSILQPILRFIQSIVESLTSLVVQSVSVMAAIVRRAIDVLWYGPVEGVTTTGISRAGGFQSLLASSSFVMMMASSMVIIGLMTLLVREKHPGMVTDGDDRNHNGYLNAFRVWRIRRPQVNDMANEILDEQEDYYDSDQDSNESPSAEEELKFLHSFDAANPTSRESASKRSTNKRHLWPFQHRQRASRQGQRQRSIKSIQYWWRQRPSSAVAIIEPPHGPPNHQPPPSHQITHLQHQLAQSEQERAVLQLDVQRLQHRLQKAQHDSRAIVEKNKWLEMQQAKADKILTRALEVERRKANSEMERVRDTMKHVLERERMLMRERLADTMNTGRLRREETEGNNVTHVEGKASGLIEGVVTSPMEEVAMDSDGYDDKDSIWGERQRSLRRNLNGGNEGMGAIPTIIGGQNHSTLSRRHNNFTRL